MQLTINRVKRLVVCMPIVYYRLGDACGQRDRTLRLGGGCSQLMPGVVGQTTTAEAPPAAPTQVALA